MLCRCGRHCWGAPEQLVQSGYLVHSGYPLPLVHLLGKHDIQAAEFECS